MSTKRSVHVSGCGKRNNFGGLSRVPGRRRCPFGATISKQHSAGMSSVGSRMGEPRHSRWTWRGSFSQRAQSAVPTGMPTMGFETRKYLDYARECTKQAERTDSPERRDRLIELARVWMEAALSEEAAMRQTQVSERLP